MPDRILVTGAAGMLGRRLLEDAPRGFEAVGVTRADAELSDAGAVDPLFSGEPPAGVIHAAGFTDVDGAEKREEQAYRDNETATRVVAEACARTRVPLLVVSTDYVFDGTLDRAYREDDTTRPLNVYGRSKLAAERAALEAHPRGTRVVRTAWMYGPGGRHFPGRVLEIARERDEIRVVADQVGCPTSVLELAPVLWEILEASPGIYHAACEGCCSWYELAVATLELAGAGASRVVPCTTAEMPRPARRPARTVLDCSKLASLRGARMVPWRDALMRYLAGETS